VVYGVEVPNTDGKAGMAGIVAKSADLKLDFEEILRESSKQLPAYAKPLFIRVKADGKLPTTSTMKYLKSGLVKEGFDPSQVGKDKLYYFDSKSGKYIEITKDIYEKIQSGSIRF